MVARMGGRVGEFVQQHLIAWLFPEVRVQPSPRLRGLKGHRLCGSLDLVVRLRQVLAAAR